MNCYIHVPFCRSKCAYCAFYSVPGAADELKKRYLERLIRELASCPETFDTVYIGGGTPTFLEEQDLERIFSVLRTAPGAEISMEANPETLTAEKAAMLANYVTRLSMGVQSFDEAKRRKLGRECSDEAIRRALEYSALFPHRNLDLMYAVPGDSMGGFAADLRLAVASGADHVSCYSLTPEEQTRFAGTVIDEDLSADLWKLAGDVLGERGILRYEVSNCARPGAECRHNESVWYGGLLRGFGPAAASYDGMKRYREVESVTGWLEGAPVEEDVLPPDARRREIFVTGLRTVAGWSRQAYLALPGALKSEWETFGRTLAEFPENLREVSPENLRLTEAGLLFWDSFAVELL